ncbi:MAG: glycosyltransferase family 9 protein [Gammaproteobacteria bacterium]|nr:glycosyltransferase family 9 protein [Gammaproteobacteria bacterium]
MAFSSGQAPESVCVIRLSAIGDCCHTLPVLRTLQHAWPATRITWIIGRTEHGLMQGVDGIECITFDKAGPWGGLRALHRQLRGRRFPLLLHMHASMRANLASRTIDAARRIGFDRDRARDYQWLFTNEQITPRPDCHVMDGLFGFLEHLGIGERVLRWDIPLADADRAFAAEHGDGDGPVVVVSPCSSQRWRNFRNWSPGHYATVIDHLQECRGARVLLTGGPTPLEQRYGVEISAAVRRPVANLIGRTTLKQLLALLERADVLVAPDSGPVHMATAVGTPVVGLYATSNRRRTGPYLSQDLVVDRYPEAVQREFGVPVGELRWGQRVRDPAAMDLIQPQAVIEKVEQALRAGACR